MLCHTYLLGLFLAASMVAAKPAASSEAPFPTSSESDDKTKTKKTKSKDTFSTGIVSYAYSSVPVIPPEPTRNPTPTPLPPCIPSTFKLTVVVDEFNGVNFFGTPAPPINNSYLSAELSDVLKTVTADRASVFTLNADCSLVYDRKIAALPPGATDSPFTFIIPHVITDNGYSKAACRTSEGYLFCHINTGGSILHVPYTCSTTDPYYISIGATGPINLGTQCFALAFRLAPISPPTPSSTSQELTSTYEPPSTTSSKPVPTCSTSLLKLTVVLAFEYGSAPNITGNYLSAVDIGGPGDAASSILKLETNASLASTFRLNADCSLSYGGRLAALPPGIATGSFEFFHPDTINAGGYYKAVCSSNGVGLSCSIYTGNPSFTNSVFYTYAGGSPPYYLTIAPTSRPNNAGYYTLGLRLAPL